MFEAVYHMFITCLSLKLFITCLSQQALNSCAWSIISLSVVGKQAPHTKHSTWTRNTTVPLLTALAPVGQVMPGKPGDDLDAYPHPGQHKFHQFVRDLDHIWFTYGEMFYLPGLLPKLHSLFRPLNRKKCCKWVTLLHFLFQERTFKGKTLLLLYLCYM